MVDGNNELTSRIPAISTRRFARFLQHPGPALLDVVTNTQELVILPSIKAEQAKGFSLWALRGVLNGRAGQVIDLARTSFLR